MADTTMDIEVLTPDGWKNAKLEVWKPKPGDHHVGLKIELPDGTGIGMSLPERSVLILYRALDLFV